MHDGTIAAYEVVVGDALADGSLVERQELLADDPAVEEISIWVNGEETNMLTGERVVVDVARHHALTAAEHLLAALRAMDATDDRWLEVELASLPYGMTKAALKAVLAHNITGDDDETEALYELAVRTGESIGWAIVERAKDRATTS